MMKRLVTAFCAAVLSATAAQGASGQDRLFQSHQSANLATTETLRGGNWLFEISHRFAVPMSEGSKELWGIDGPAVIRLGLGFAPTDRVLLGIIRTNNEDNLELNGRARFLEASLGGTPVHLAAAVGGAWNTDPVLSEGAEDNEFQFYAQLVANALIADRLAVGLAPTYLRNPRIRDFETNNTSSLGVYGQWYLGGTFSLLGEWIFSEEIPDLEHDTGTFGLEIRTRGHHFKIVATNQPAINPTQHLAGSPYPFTLDELRLGFNITRLLPF
jgi:hypothetical protein